MMHSYVDNKGAPRGPRISFRVPNQAGRVERKRKGMKLEFSRADEKSASALSDAEMAEESGFPSRGQGVRCEVILSHPTSNLTVSPPETRVQYVNSYKTTVRFVLRPGFHTGCFPMTAIF